MVARRRQVGAGCLALLVSSAQSAPARPLTPLTLQESIQLVASPAPTPMASDKRCDMMGEAPTTKQCVGKKKPIIIAGEGKTGTETLATALAMMGYKVAHFDSLLQCCELSNDNDNLFAKKNMFSNTTKCNTYPKGSTKTCNSISWSCAPTYDTLREKMTAWSTNEYDTADFCVFDEFEVYGDVPMPSFAPYIYAAYGPGTKIIITQRPATYWAPRRAQWDIGNDLNDTAPLSYMFSDSLNDAAAAGAVGNEPTSYKRSHTANEYAYLAERALIECIAQPEDVLLIDVFTETDDPQKMWHKLSKFLGRPLGDIETKFFPRDTPSSPTEPGCHSWNVDAFYCDEPSPTTGKEQQLYFIPVPAWAKPEFSCPSNGMNVPISPFNLVPSPQALPAPNLTQILGMIPGAGSGLAKAFGPDGR